MGTPGHDSLSAAADEATDQLQQAATTERLRTYDTLLREWYVLSRQWSQIVSDGNPTATDGAETIERRLEDVQTEVNAVVEDFAPDEFDRVMRHVLEE